jgi:GTPase SAR1 family protein
MPLIGQEEQPIINKPNIQQQAPVDLKAELDKLREQTTQEIADRYNTFNMILLGDSGVGKTSILNTARMPVLIHSFDPGGAKLAHLRPLINSGEIIYDGRFEHDSVDNPTAYMAWEAEFIRLKSMGIFSQIGTYVVDSYTTFMASAKNELIKRRMGGNVRDLKPKKGSWEGILEKQDWQILGQITIDMVKLATALPCDFILTGHTTLVPDETTGRQLVRFNSIPSLRVDVPLLFDEIYVMQAEDSPQGMSRRFITNTTGRYIARTRIGSGIFDTYEPADIGKLLKKAGMIGEEETKVEAII